MKSLNIEIRNIGTRNGNLIQVVYNPNNSLLTVDLIHEDESGGNELFRQTLEEDNLLKHCNEKEKA
jgi:hypothetical protein